jgi:hypothetical protein
MHGFLSGTYSSSYRGEDRSLLETELNLCGELLLSRAIKFNKFIILKYRHHQLPQSLVHSRVANEPEMPICDLLSESFRVYRKQLQSSTFHYLFPTKLNIVEGF